MNYKVINIVKKIDVSTKFGPKKKSIVNFENDTDPSGNMRPVHVWHDCILGNTYDGEIIKKSYENKEGMPVEYWELKMEKKGMGEATLKEISGKLDIIIGLLDPKKRPVTEADLHI